MSWSTGTNLIEEGGMPKALTIQMIEVEKEGGGTEYFVRKSDTKLTTKSISKNGTYNASSDDAYGYSKVTVNVSGGNGSADSHGRPTTSDGVNPGGPGSAVIGTDPETGNEVAVGVDEDGNLVQTPVPSYIKVTKPPDKTEYNVGDTINPTGIIVHAYLADGTDFGTVLNSELVYPEPVAPESTKSKGYAGGPPAVSQIEPINGVEGFIPGVWSKDRYGRYWFDPVYWNHTYYSGISVFGTNDRQIGEKTTVDGMLVVASSKENELLYVEHYDSDKETRSKLEYTYMGKTVYYYAKHITGPSGTIDSVTDGVIPPWSDGSSLYGPIAWTLIYGNLVGGTAEIPVKWKSPYDGKEYEDTFEITVTSTGGSHTSESSSGTEGSGGGGGF